ncbi:hypothetical protein VP01_677g2 [Puccinia sorghi]|uniref:Uncharacterized protein n=1 Tax=Puccinia sorghi TaxID=27349 RepID=A0A0L6UEK8_9BASI|nr:hypothetical protein VP01_677g2 [Puccinia sorghi]
MHPREIQVKSDDKGVELEEKKFNHSVALEEKKLYHGIKLEEKMWDQTRGEELAHSFSKEILTPLNKNQALDSLSVDSLNTIQFPGFPNLYPRLALDEIVGKRSFNVLDTVTFCGQSNRKNIILQIQGQSLDIENTLDFQVLQIGDSPSILNVVHKELID